MFRKTLSIALTGLLFHTTVVSVFARQSISEDAHVVRIKTDVAKRAAGENAGVKVKLRDAHEVQGFISHVGIQNFVISDEKARTSTTIAYRDVTEVKRKGLSKGTKIGIAVAIAVGAAAIAAGVGTKGGAVKFQ